MRLTFRLASIVVVVVLTGAAYAGATCNTYIDSRAYDDGQYAFCWLSGSLCAVCYDTEEGVSCASEMRPCNPYPPGTPLRPTVQLRDREVHQMFASAAGLGAPCVSRSLQTDKEGRLLAGIL